MLKNYEHPQAAASLGELCDIIYELTEKWGGKQTTTLPWFRGQENHQWLLQPKIYRTGFDSLYEREMIRDFKLKSLQHINGAIANEIDWLVLMQHYGMPTRLIDWSESYLIAIFFAVEHCDNKNDGAIWIIDPWKLNIKSLKQQTVPISSSDLLSEYYINVSDETIQRSIKSYLPSAFRPTYNNTRIIAQKGMFTIHGRRKTPIEKTLSTQIKNGIYKIRINKEKKRRIYQELCQAGITRDVVYPDLSGLCETIAEKYSNL